MIDNLIKEEVDPVGSTLANEKINDYVNSMKESWDSSKKKKSIWTSVGTISLTPVTNFLLLCLDEMIDIADEMNEAPGKDKKATVIHGISLLYDHVIKDALPIWAKPFAYLIRNYIIGILISSAIDWIVTSYRKKRNKKGVE